MAGVSGKKIHSTLSDLSKLMSNEDLHKVLEKSVKDKKLLEKAKDNPRVFLKGEGISLPRGVDATITARPVGGAITICLTICRRIGRYVFCIRICRTIIIR